MCISESQLQVSVIIPVYEDIKGITLTLESLRKQSLASSIFEVVVANDGGASEVENLCDDYSVRCIDIVPNRGAYYARNRAIEQAKADNCAFVDADITVPTHWLERGLAALEQYHYVAGGVKIEKAKIRQIADLHEFYTAFDIRKYIQQHHFGVTANLFVRKEIFDEVGLFDERLRSSGDLEFGDRVHQYDQSIQKYASDITVLHPPRGFRNYSKKIKRGAVGQVMLKKYYPNRFPEIDPGYGKAVVKAIIPPITWLNKVYKHENIETVFLLFMFRWYVNIMRSFYIIQALLKQ
ncbi:MAG: glycosyltransferase [Bacteroidota bacterium]